MGEEEAELHELGELGEALAGFDERTPGEVVPFPEPVDQAALRAALGGEPPPLVARRDGTILPTNPAPGATPARETTPPLELDFPEGGDRLVGDTSAPRRVPDGERPSGNGSVAPEFFDDGGPRRRVWIGVALVALVLAGVLVLLAVRASSRENADERITAAPPAPATSVANDGSAPPADFDQLTPDVAQLLTVMGLSDDRIATIDSGPLIDAGEGDALPSQPRIEQAGAFVLTLDDQAVADLFGGNGTAPCGTRNDLYGATFHATCTSAALEPTAGDYLVIWVDTGVSLLAPEARDASLRGSIDVNADGAVDIPANIVAKGDDPAELTDGATGLGTRAVILGTAMAFLVPVDTDVVPQWAFATASTSGQLSDITDWQRWVITSENERQAAPAVYGEDVHP